MFRRITGLMVTPRLIEFVLGMGDGWWRVTRRLDRRSVARPISASVANRLVKLGWAEKDVQRSLDRNIHPATFVRLNEAGRARAAEFAQVTEANAQS